MNKTLCKIISATILAISLGIMGTTAMPSYPVSASIEEDGLKNQCIYREGDYIIAKENASYLALVQTVWIEFNDFVNYTSYMGYDAPTYVGTKTFDDGTTVTVEKNGDNYLITYKIKKSVFTDLNTVKAKFETESFGGSHYPHYIDDNGGHGYSL